MSRLTDFLNLGKGVFVLSFLIKPDIPLIKNVSKEIKTICEENEENISFYDLPIIYDGKERISNFLFRKDYESLEKCLKQKNDQFIDSPYCHYDKEKGEYVPSMHRSTIYNCLWNGLCMLEIAYMLRDVKAIELLKRYDRKIFHVMSSYQTHYGKDSFYILEKYVQQEILNLLKLEI